MFPVEIRIIERDEHALTARMTSMREWLDHQRFEPCTFRYSFTFSGIVFQVDFAIGTEAEAFASAFGGRVIKAPAAISP